MLYDGSAEAREILSNALNVILDAHTGTEADYNALGVLGHALDCLKGKNAINLGRWTREIMGEPEDVPSSAA